MIRGKTLQLRLGENINVPKISGSPIRNTDCKSKKEQPKIAERKGAKLKTS